MKKTRIRLLETAVIVLGIGAALYYYHLPRGYYGDAQHYSYDSACSIYIAEQASQNGGDFGLLGPIGNNMRDGKVFANEEEYIRLFMSKEGKVGPMRVWFYNPELSTGDLITSYWDAEQNPKLFFTYRKNRSCKLTEIKVYRWPISAAFGEAVRENTFAYSEEISYSWKKAVPLLGISQGSIKVEPGYLYSFMVFWEEKGHSNFCEYPLVTKA